MIGVLISDDYCITAGCATNCPGILSITLRNLNLTSLRLPLCDLTQFKWLTSGGEALLLCTLAEYFLSSNKSISLPRSTSLPTLIQCKTFIQMSLDLIHRINVRNAEDVHFFSLSQDMFTFELIRGWGWGREDRKSLLFAFSSCSILCIHYTTAIINMCPWKQRIITFYQDQHDNENLCGKLIGCFLEEMAHCEHFIGQY